MLKEPYNMSKELSNTLLDNTFHQSPIMHQKEPYYASKEPYNMSKEPCNVSKEPYNASKEPYHMWWPT